jgi:hypothetical protein
MSQIPLINQYIVAAFELRHHRNNAVDNFERAFHDGRLWRDLIENGVRPVSDPQSPESHRRWRWWLRNHSLRHVTRGVHASMTKVTPLAFHLVLIARWRDASTLVEMVEAAGFQGFATCVGWGVAVGYTSDPETGRWALNRGS